MGKCTLTFCKETVCSSLSLCGAQSCVSKKVHINCKYLFTLYGFLYRIRYIIIRAAYRPHKNFHGNSIDIHIQPIYISVKCRKLGFFIFSSFCTIAIGPKNIKTYFPFSLTRLYLILFFSITLNLMLQLLHQSSDLFYYRF